MEMLVDTGAAPGHGGDVVVMELLMGLLRAADQSAHPELIEVSPWSDTYSEGLDFGGRRR
jgi:hypothetical protein